MKEEGGRQANTGRGACCPPVLAEPAHQNNRTSQLRAVLVRRAQWEGTQAPAPIGTTRLPWWDHRFPKSSVLPALLHRGERERSASSEGVFNGGRSGSRTAQACPTAWPLGSTTCSIQDCVDWNVGHRSPSPGASAPTRSCEPPDVAGPARHPPSREEGGGRASSDGSLVPQVAAEPCLSSVAGESEIGKLGGRINIAIASLNSREVVRICRHG